MDGDPMIALLIVGIVVVLLASCMAGLGVETPATRQRADRALRDEFRKNGGL